MSCVDVIGLDKVGFNRHTMRVVIFEHGTNQKHPVRNTKQFPSVLTREYFLCIKSQEAKTSQ